MPTRNNNGQSVEREEIEIDNQKIFFKSSEQMDEIPDDFIDLIITSPPYNRGKNYSADDNQFYDDNMPEEDYLSFLTAVWKECFRVSKEKALFFLNIGDSAQDQGISEKVAQSAVNAGWHRVQDIIWIKSIYGKGHYTPSGGNRRFNNIWEHVYMFAKNARAYKLNPKAIGIPYADKSNVGRYGEVDMRDAGNVWHICYEKTTGASVKKGHDAPFPLGLPYRCIKCVPGATRILDPFLGTGTTLAATRLLGVEGYGYEKYPRKEIIIQTIEKVPNYVPKPPILLPHYDHSIKTLVELIETLEVDIDPIKSKKKLNQLKILSNTLETLKLTGKLYSSIQTRINQQKKTSPKD
ncbi:hypothetical protein NEF87_004379 [Candidatus Lokiarchaeum ossiferum]|uniref:Type II methyltransferase n=1 Tax=Candidatus Lokiarchaeum ossiferum TaxID=2951803 RepID=A0ABY6HZU6_9ARCH|nr:hypothetical protein NEF87_004379 [Candidatus Lokiarchaeum sp. B-35]